MLHRRVASIFSHQGASSSRKLPCFIASVGTSSASSTRVMLTRQTASSVNASAGQPRLHFYGLDNTTGGLALALRKIHEVRPKQVMLETCDQRRMLAERRLVAVSKLDSSGDVVAPATDQRASLSQTDAIDIVHGGIRAMDLVQLTQAAGDIGAQVYMVDRPYRETQNAVARQLLLHPSEFLPFVRHYLGRIDALSLPSSSPTDTCNDSGQVEDFSVKCPGAHSIIADSRERYMADSVAKFAVGGGDVLVFCTTERIEGLKMLLADGCEQMLYKEPTSKSKRVLNIWPVLLVFVYLMTPLYVSLCLMWILSQWLAKILTEASSRLTFSRATDNTASDTSSQAKIAE